MPRAGWRRGAAILLFGIAGVAVLVALGVWQIQRLSWKTEVLARIEARLAADPVAIPANPAAATDQYRRVRVTGEIAEGELHVYTSVARRGVGYRVIVPLALEDGRRVLLDRGFVPIEQKDARRRRGPITIDGALLWPRETDGFTPTPDRDANIWFARDAEAMAAALGTLPVMLVVAASDDPEAPLPLPVSVNVANDHLQYAITWFALACGWAGMTGYALWRITRRTY